MSKTSQANRICLNYKESTQHLNPKRKHCSLLYVNYKCTGRKLFTGYSMTTSFPAVDFRGVFFSPSQRKYSLAIDYFYDLS